MNVKRFLFPAAAAVLLLLCVAGCRSTGGAPADRDREVFQRISDRLDADGSYYRIQNPAHLFDSLERVDRMLDNSIARSGLPDELCDELMRYKALTGLVIRLSGIAELEGIGTSSLLLEEGKNGSGTLFRNRMFLAFPGDAEGFLWKIAGSENRPLARDLVALPVNTVLAADFVFRPVEVYRELSRSDALKAELDAASLALGMTPEEFLENISGEWAFLLTAPEDADLDSLEKLNLLLVMPDKERCVFNWIAGIAALLPNIATREGDTISFSFQDNPMFGPLGNRVPRIVWSDGQITFYSSEQAMTEFASGAVERLVSTAEFQRLMRQLPPTGIGFCYSGGNFWRLLARGAGEIISAGLLEIDPEGEYPSELTILRRENDGLLAVGNSSWDYNQMEFAAQTFLPLMLFIEAGLPQLYDTEDSTEIAELQEEYNSQCLEQLEKLKTALNSYADAHDGKFPDGEDVAGLKQLLKSGFAQPGDMICPGAEVDEPAENIEEFSFQNASYVYFAGLKRDSNGKLPLLADWPFNHAERVNVLLVDGTIESIDADDVSTCKRIVGFLQARYKYDEAEFRELIRLADKLDKLFDLD